MVLAVNKRSDKLYIAREIKVGSRFNYFVARSSPCANFVINYLLDFCETVLFFSITYETARPKYIVLFAIKK